jgi:hypothetical protein
MNNCHEIHSWSKEYREEVLHGVCTIRLEGRLRKDREARSGRGPVGLALANVLSLVRGV